MSQSPQDTAPPPVPTAPLLAAALGVGIAGDLLLRGAPVRLGLALWMVGLALVAARLGAAAIRERALLLAGTALAPLGLVWRDAEIFYAIDLLSLLCMGALTIWHGSGRRLRELTVVEAARAALLALVNTAFGGATAVDGALRQYAARSAGRSQGRAVLIGTVLAVPPLAIVTSLLASSDVVFSGVLEQVVTLLTFDGLRHLFIATLLAWIAAGWLRASTGTALTMLVPEVRSPGLAFPMVAVALYALVAVLALFVATQARVLFGGAAFLRATEGLTVAEYARSGFFQLVLAAAVVLGTLAMADWLLAADDASGRRRYRVAGTLLLVLVTALLVSAAARIWLYVAEFGLSIDRALAAAGIVWVAAALASFAATTLRGRSAQFGPAVLWSTAGWVILVNLVNLEARVADVNLARAARGAPFDIEYHAALSADAVPTLLQAAHRLPEGECTALVATLRTTWAARLAPDAEGTGWRSWNLPRHGLPERLAQETWCSEH